MIDREKLMERFKELDLDNDGFLNFEEIKRGFKQYAEMYPDVDSFTDEEIEIFLTVADNDEDGLISYEEFVFNLEI